MPTLTTEERAAYEAQLAEAQAAYHSVMIGGHVREFYDQNGERIVYSSTSRTALLSYINWLRGQLGMCALEGFVSRPAGVYL